MVWGNLSPSPFRNVNYRVGSYGHMFTRLNEVKQISDVDILFLGSSHAYRGFDPRMFAENNVKTFNLGSSAQTPIQTKLLLERYLEQLNPKLIIYEVFPNTFTSDGVESSLDIIANDKIDRYTLNMALELNHIKTYNTLLFGYFSDLTNLNSKYSEPLEKNNDIYVSGGYVEKDLSYYKYVSNQAWSINLLEHQLIKFREIEQMIREAGIELILIFAPITSSSYKSYLNLPEFKQSLSNDQNYYDFNEILTLDDSLHFYDSHHLNQIGVELFNKKLIEILYDHNWLDSQ